MCVKLAWELPSNENCSAPWIDCILLQHCFSSLGVMVRVQLVPPQQKRGPGPASNTGPTQPRASPFHSKNTPGFTSHTAALRMEWDPETKSSGSCPGTPARKGSNSWPQPRMSQLPAQKQTCLFTEEYPGLLATPLGCSAFASWHPLKVISSYSKY